MAIGERSLLSARPLDPAEAAPSGSALRWPAVRPLERLGVRPDGARLDAAAPLAAADPRGAPAPTAGCPVLAFTADGTATMRTSLDRRGQSR